MKGSESIFAASSSAGRRTFFAKVAKRSRTSRRKPPRTQISPTARQPNPNVSSNSEHAIASASSLQRSTRHCVDSKMALTDFVKKLASPSRSSDSTLVRSPHCPSKRRNATSGANAFIATISRHDTAGARLRPYLSQPLRPTRRIVLERHQDIEQLLAVARILHVCNVALTAICDSGLGDLRKVDGIVAGDVFGAYHAGNLQVAQFAVHTHLLMSTDDEIAIRHHLGDESSQRQIDRFRAIDGTRALLRAG